MIEITSYLHRNSLYDLIQRWMCNDLQSSDAGLITRLVHFNNVFVSRYLHSFSEQVFGRLHEQGLQTRRVRIKSGLKDAIVVNPPYTNDRIASLLLEYRQHPGRYYRETPFHGTLYFTSRNGDDLYIGSNRIKRVRRLAEKISRRIIDRIFEAIKARADHLAEVRARDMGITRYQLVTPPSDMIAEFRRAEARLLDDLQHKRPIEDGKPMVIQDVAGIKVILEDNEQKRLFDLLNAWDACEIIEVEPHSGRYNATNVIVRFRPDIDSLLEEPLSRTIIRLMQSRGLDPDEVPGAFSDFVRSGEEAVHIEVIISSYQEMLESEIGRCMHEDRITEQRLRQEYRGHLAKNIEYLMEYLFASSVSPKTELVELPVLLWNTYLPDYYDEVVKALFDIPLVHVTD
ncbi:MAG: hypothetical protein JXR96_03475 [Deltaproteobacteria bacterium]|nr:hypothetical protein [Deltaproteobacteria bacterium]